MVAASPCRIPAWPRRRDPVPMDIRVRSLLGSDCWSSANALISWRGWESDFRMLSMEGPPGIIRTSYSLRSSRASS